MKLNKIKKTIVFVLAAVMCLSMVGCGRYDEMTNSETDEFYLTKEAEMDQETKDTLDKISEGFLNFLTTGDTATVNENIDPSVGVTDEQLYAFYENYAESNPFTVYDSYYIKDVKPEEVTRKFKKSADDEFGVEITPGSSEMHMVLFVSENEKISHMVSMLCAKDKEWKIVWIDASDFKYDSRDALSLYEETSKLSEEGNFFAAYATSLKMNLIMRPGNTLVHNSYPEMEDLFYKLQTDFQKNYPTPYTAEGSDMKLLALALAKEEGEIVPLLILQSDLELDNVSKLKKEAEKFAEALSPEFAEYFDVISVNVYNEDPNTAETEAEAAHFVLD